VERICSDEVSEVRIQRRKRLQVLADQQLWAYTKTLFSNHFWVLNFQFDRTKYARVLRLLAVTDEFTKTALAIWPEKLMRSFDMV